MAKLPSIKKLQWPADKVERRKVDDLVPYASNARTHSKEQIDQIRDLADPNGCTDHVARYWTATNVHITMTVQRNR